MRGTIGKTLPSWQCHPILSCMNNATRRLVQTLFRYINHGTNANGFRPWALLPFLPYASGRVRLQQLLNVRKLFDSLHFESF